ncbi:ATP-binding protein [Amycolatopsis sp. WAC 01375]|uniref:ATP-binding protein n=1 Tax=unclassified Amycolatopsis TaxID=2618356 RepID=UPI000F7837CF|nr:MULTISPECIES: ATP-binding protein [unclassified Amycolatopsis]RSM79716.1 ATP-binding protein [Amycolatopsis sp. WAC 01375]RSN27444.1 ATP-binding protein [Amycolatopsis sp. WAC 01416]
MPIDEPVRETTGELILEVAAVPAQAAALRDLLAKWALERGLPRELAEDLKLTSYEAMTNVVRHAYPDGTDANVMTITAAHEDGRLKITVADEGRWRDGRRPDGGRGLPIIRAFAPEASVTSTPTGTIVRLAWPCPAV